MKPEYFCEDLVTSEVLDITKLEDDEFVSFRSSGGDRFQRFKVFREDRYMGRSDEVLLNKLISDVTYDEDQSSDESIVQDGAKKAKSFLVI